MTTQRLFSLVSISLWILLISASAQAQTAPTASAQLQIDTQSLLHNLDYIAVDYPGAVHEGVVQDAGEYGEQQEFAAQMAEIIKRLPPHPQTPTLAAKITQLQQAIADRLPGEEVAAQCRAASALLIETYQVPVAPLTPPALDVGRQLFQSQCTQCHGATGLGDGMLAATLNPPPANFHDRERQSQRSLYSLYATLTLGVDGTAMPAFSQLSEAQRWALAFYVSNFFASDAERQQGEQAWKQVSEKQGHTAIYNLNQLALLTPAQALQQGGEQKMAQLAYLRANPAALIPASQDAIGTTRHKLAASLEAYRSGQTTQAYELAVSAYLDGFELTEGQLKTMAPELRKQVETSMAGYRQALKSALPVAEVEPLYQGIQSQLDEVQTVLGDAAESVTVTLLSSMLILLREGLEAILVLAAIGAFLAKADRSHHINYVHIGWVSALILGIATWVIAQNYIDISGANREITEGIAALVAAGMLLYVGFWLHRQSNARQWQKFLHDKLDTQMKKGALWGLVFIAFLAVYREVLETALFYQAFWLQSSDKGHDYIVMGFAIAAVLLVAIAWAFFRFSVRLPLRPFFLTNAVLLFVLSLVYTGKGIMALQESGLMLKNPISFFEIDLLGIYPNMQSLGAQAVILLAAAIWLYTQRAAR